MTVTLVTPTAAVKGTPEAGQNNRQTSSKTCWLTKSLKQEMLTITRPKDNLFFYTLKKIQHSTILFPEARTRYFATTDDLTHWLVVSLSLRGTTLA